MTLKIIWDSQKRSEEQAVKAVQAIYAHKRMYEGYNPYAPPIPNIDDAVMMTTCGHCETAKVWVKKGQSSLCVDCKKIHEDLETHHRIEQLGRIKALDKATGGAEGSIE